MYVCVINVIIRSNNESSSYTDSERHKCDNKIQYHNDVAICVGATLIIRFSVYHVQVIMILDQVTM